MYVYTYTYMQFIKKNKKALHTGILLRESFSYMLFLITRGGEDLDKSRYRQKK